MLLLCLSLAQAATTTIPLETGSGMLAVRPWDLPAPVLLEDGSLVRAHYGDDNLVVTRIPASGGEPVWTHTIAAPRTVVAPTVENYESLMGMAGTFPWLLDADAELTRIVSGFGGGSTVAILQTATGKTVLDQNVAAPGFAGGYVERASRVIALASGHKGELSIQSYTSSGQPLATLSGAVQPKEYHYVVGPPLLTWPFWAEEGLDDTAVGPDGSVALVVGEGSGRVHLERWTSKGDKQVGSTLIEGVARVSALRQTSDGGTLAILRATKGKPGFRTTDILGCAAPAGDVLEAVCTPVGLKQIVGKKVKDFVVVDSEPTRDGGFVIAVQENRDMHGRTNVTRRRGDLYLLALKPDGSLLSYSELHFVTRKPISFTANSIVSPATFVTDGQRILLVTAEPFGSMFNQKWRLEVSPMQGATGAVGDPILTFETDRVPVTASLSCAGGRCSAIEVDEGDARIVVFDGR